MSCSTHSFVARCPSMIRACPRSMRKSNAVSSSIQASSAQNASTYSHACSSSTHPREPPSLRFSRIRGRVSPPDAHILHREPLRADELDRQVIRGMSGFEFGSERATDLTTRVVKSYEYDAAHTPQLSEHTVFAHTRHLSERIGFRTVGTRERVRADAWMLGQADALKALCDDAVRAEPGRQLECQVWHQQASSSHRFDILGKRLYKSYDAILANAHLACTLPSPGAADNALAPGIILEAVHTVVCTPHWSPMHALQPVRGSVRAVINLEAAGSTGPELLFQTTSTQTIGAYVRLYCTVVANNIFSSGVLISDTDFRKFELYLDVTELDIANVDHSYFYHMRKDTVHYIQLGVAQYMSDNALVLLRFLSSPDSPLPELTTGYTRPTTVPQRFFRAVRLIDRHRAVPRPPHVQRPRRLTKREHRRPQSDQAKADYSMALPRLPAPASTHYSGLSYNTHAELARLCLSHARATLVLNRFGERAERACEDSATARTVRIDAPSQSQSQPTPDDGVDAPRLGLSARQKQQQPAPEIDPELGGYSPSSHIASSLVREFGTLLGGTRRDDFWLSKRSSILGGPSPGPSGDVGERERRESVQRDAEEKPDSERESAARAYRRARASRSAACTGARPRVSTCRGAWHGTNGEAACLDNNVKVAAGHQNPARFRPGVGAVPRDEEGIRVPPRAVALSSLQSGQLDNTRCSHQFTLSGANDHFDVAQRRSCPPSKLSFGLRDAESSFANIDIATQIATSLGVLRTLRVQIWRVLEDCMTMRVVQHDTAIRDARGADVWDARKVGVFLVRAVRVWTASPAPTEKERVFEEEMDERVKDCGETGNGFNDYDTASANDDGTPMPLSLSPAHPAPNPLLRILAFLFSRMQTTVSFNPPLPLSLLAIIPHVLWRSGAAHQLMPPTAGWHATWELLFACDMPAKPVMRRAVHGQLASVYEKVKSVRSYRRPLVELLFEFWMQRVEHEIALRSTEEDNSADDIPSTTSEPTVHNIMVAMMSVSGYCDCDGKLDASARLANTAPVSPSVPLTPTSEVGSPIATWTSEDSPTAPRKEKEKEKEAGSNNMQQVMSLRTFTGSRHQSQTQVLQLSSSSDESPTPRAEASSPPLPGGSNSPRILCQGLTAARAVIDMFTRLAFADYVMTPRASGSSFIGRLLKQLRTAPCPHGPPPVSRECGAEHEQQIYTLVRLVGRLRGVPSTAHSDEAARNEEIFVERASATQTFERNGRRTSRGGGAGRLIPNIVPFSLENAEKGSRPLVTYDPQSDYIDVPVELLKAERDWGGAVVLAIAGVLVELCKGVLNGTLGWYVPQEEWPSPLKTRDAQSLAYHTLTVLISYQTIFNKPKRQVLVEVFQAGLRFQS
ncbi:hypothetical protein DFH11DRAFT_1883465 [Phellopilus nigrolimitatus]|nr:hypothetical protein DFH11DRAFT_1883465 [Phellopilus nigrolimitatus]